MKAKKEAADAKKSEDDLKIEHEETRMTLEQNIQKLEEMKLELAEVQGELNNLKEFSRKKSEEKSAMLKSMESRFIALQVEICGGILFSSNYQESGFTERWVESLTEFFSRGPVRVRADENLSAFRRSVLVI